MIAIVERTFGLLSFVAILFTVACVLALGRGRVPPWLSDLALPAGTAISVVATGGSLFLSEVAGYVPCTLCWYQRIAMYPLVIVMGVAAARRDTDVWRTVVPIASIGSMIAVWHIVIERRPTLGGVCDPAAPCAIRWVEEFGFMTLPVMALIGFVAIMASSLVARDGATSPW